MAVAPQSFSGRIEIKGAMHPGFNEILTPEAVALHAIDLLDSRLTIAVREIAEDRGESAWTPYNASLGRRLYKGGRSPAAADETD